MSEDLTGSMPEEAINYDEQATRVVDEIVNLAHRPIIEMHDQIERGDYKVLFGDDASGRAATLVWRGFLGQINSDHNEPKPETLFLAGSRDLEVPQMVAKIKQITEYLKKRKIKELFQEKTDKALIVTDTVQTGQSLLPLTHALSNLGIRYEIMTNVLVEEVPQAMIESNLGAKIYYGDKRNEDMVPYAYKNTAISGVAKNPEELFATPEDLTDQTANLSTHEILDKSRVLIEPAAQKLTDYYRQLK